MRLICLLILFSAFKSAGSSLYEQCDWKNKAYTERLIRESQKLFPKTEACSDCFMPEKKGQNWWFEWINDFFLWPKEEDIPVECFFASGTKTLTKGPGSKNYYYCKSKKSMKPLEKMRLTDSRGKRRYVSPRKPCLNFPYTLMTSKAFHYMTDCFDFSQREKNYLFALFNRESSFILNNRSKGHARCYGQLRATVVKDINESIYFENVLGSKIYRQALQRCEDLNEKVWIDPKIIPVRMGGKGETRSYSRLEKINKKIRVTCRLTQDPATCFFYSLFNMQKNRIRLEVALNTVDKKIPRKTKVPENIKQDFLFPIRLNEVLHVKGIVKVNGKKRRIDEIFENNNEVYKSMKEVQYDPKDLAIKKVKLFKIDFNRKWKILYWLYNGGSSVADTYIWNFIREEKKTLSRECKRNHMGFQRCKHRRQIIQNRSLPFDTEKFESYLQLNYDGSQKRRKEVAEFISDIKKDMNYLTNEGRLKIHLQSLHKNNPDIEQEDIDEFVDRVEKHCPKIEIYTDRV